MIVSSESTVSQPLKDFARKHGVDVYDESLNLLNP